MECHTCRSFGRCSSPFGSWRKPTGNPTWLGNSCRCLMFLWFPAKLVLKQIMDFISYWKLKSRICSLEASEHSYVCVVKNQSEHNRDDEDEVYSWYYQKERLWLILFLKVVSFFVTFTPKLWFKWSILTGAYVSNGLVKNHQLGNCLKPQLCKFTS